LIEAALVQMPDSAAVLDSMGWVLHRQKRNEQALGYLKRAYELGDDAEIAVHLGDVQWAMGDKAAAHETWQEAVKRHPGNKLLEKRWRARRSEPEGSLARAGGACGGCAVAPVAPPSPSPDPESFQYWTASGRIALAANGEGGSGSFTWGQQGRRARCRSTPARAGAMQVTADGQSLVVTDAEGRHLGASRPMRC